MVVEIVLYKKESKLVNCFMGDISAVYIYFALSLVGLKAATY